MSHVSVSRTSLSVAVLMLGMAGSAPAQTGALPDLPAAIKPGDLKPYLAVPAKGVQIYVCNKGEGGNWTWAFKAPEAELFDTAGTLIGKHYGGPSWEGTRGGKVVGAVKSSADAPAANAIPWLLLDIKSREGAGGFAEAAGILRVSTVGGRAPAAGCDEVHAGSELRVPYTATYYFLK
jgi:uncharacterized protein DUF3455